MGFDAVGTGMNTNKPDVDLHQYVVYDSPHAKRRRIILDDYAPPQSLQVHLSKIDMPELRPRPVPSPSSSATKIDKGKEKEDKKGKGKERDKEREKEEKRREKEEKKGKGKAKSRGKY